MDMRYVDVDELLKIFKKLAATIDVIPRWEIAKRMKVLKSIIEPVNEARKLPTAIKEYNEKQERIFEKYGTPVQSQGGIGYRIDDWAPVGNDISKLKEENKELLEAEEKRMKDINILLEKHVEVDIEPIDYEWCGELINGNELVTLMEFNLVNEPRDEEEIEQSNDAKIRNIRNQKKRSRKK